MNQHDFLNGLPTFLREVIDFPEENWREPIDKMKGGDQLVGEMDSLLKSALSLMFDKQDQFDVVAARLKERGIILSDLTHALDELEQIEQETDEEQDCLLEEASVLASSFMYLEQFLVMVLADRWPYDLPLFRQGFKIVFNRDDEKKAFDIMQAEDSASLN